jgi:uncharacterized phage-associated protein
MATVHDVAAYIIKKQGVMSTMRLQKLAYYSQAWHLVWEDRPLFQADFEAWANGPVCPALYRGHAGQFRISTWPTGDQRKLQPSERESIDIVLGYYGPRNGQWLSDLTHMERPWRDARHGVPDGARCQNVITKLAMQDYYSSIAPVLAAAE